MLCESETFSSDLKDLVCKLRNRNASKCQDESDHDDFKQNLHALITRLRSSSESVETVSDANRVVTSAKFVQEEEDAAPESERKCVFERLFVFPPFVARFAM